MASPHKSVLFSIIWHNPCPVMRILVVGIATLDIINRVADYPAEDSEVRAHSQHMRRGGNATNTAVVLSQLGHQVDWAGVLIEDHATPLILADLVTHNIGLAACHRLSQGTMPTSYITVSAATGSRSIVHFRDCPEYAFEQFQKISLSNYDWLHFEGRHIEDILKMLNWARQQQPMLRISIEIEKHRDQISQLIPHADYLMFSQHYATQSGFEHPTDFLASLPADIQATCSWGAQGVWGRFQNQVVHQTAFPPKQVIETLAAGDCLNAGLIHGWLQDSQSFEQTLNFASQLAGLKCGQLGLADLPIHEITMP